MAASLGVLHDLVDVRISPAFYRLFKGAPPDIPTTLWAAWIGLRAGAFAGLAAGIAFCFAGDLGPAPALPTRRILRWVPFPVVTAIVGSIVGCLVAGFWWRDLSGLLGRSSIAFLPDEVRRGVTLVNWMHTGLYAGGLFGILHAISMMMRERMRMLGRNLHD